MRSGDTTAPIHWAPFCVSYGNDIDNVPNEHVNDPIRKPWHLRRTDVLPEQKRKLVRPLFDSLQHVLDGRDEAIPTTWIALSYHL